MNKKLLAIKAAIIILSGSLFISSACQADDPLPVFHVYFSPKGGCTQAIVDALGRAKQSVLVEAYSFTAYAIAQALVDAEKRGVKVVT